MWVCSILLEQNISTCKLFFCLYFFYYIHTEIYTLKSRRVNFRSQTDVNQSNVAYRFSHMWEKSSNQEPRIMFFHVWAVRQVEVFIQGWLARFRTPHKPSLCESEESKWFLFAFLPSLILKVPVSEKQNQKGGGKEFELRSQTRTKQPWTQISQLYFISFGFYLSSFAFHEAAFFQWLLFDHICLNKACHNLGRVFNLSMYITNIIPHGKCFVRCLHTRSFVSEISLVRFAHLFDFWYATTRV